MLEPELSDEYIKSSFLFHIPHSRTLIPDYSGFNEELIDNEINLLTDFATEEIFFIEGMSALIFPYNRIFCDVERLPDADEPMFKLGRGFFYTKTDDGEILRKDVGGIKDKVFSIYQKHHTMFEREVSKKLSSVGYVNIIDCHSFSDIPFNSDLDKTEARPDICIGTDNFHTPKFLIDAIVRKCKNYHFTCKVNSPYNGTIVPLSYYKKNKQVNSVMIEINRKLYMNDQGVNYNAVRELNKFIQDIFSFQTSPQSL